MRILHLDNTANVAHLITIGLRELGVDSDVMMLSPHKFNYPLDYENYFGRSLASKFKCILNTIKIGKDYDIIHSHGGITWNRYDLVFLKNIMKKSLVVHYHGSEVLTPRSYGLDGDSYGLHFMNIVDKKIVSAPELLKRLPEAEHVLNPMVLGKYSWNEKKKLKIVHLPSRRQFKGTDVICEAIKRVQNINNNFDFKLIENVSFDIAMKEMSNSNIVIDQMYPRGYYGMVSLEAMSTGKIAVCYLKPEYRFGVPIISPESPTIDALTDVLFDLISCNKRNDLQNLSERCYDYIRIHRDPKIIAKRYLSIYEEVLRK